jgi:cation transport regulator ChaC
MIDPYFFGYGSLVNRKTHTYPLASPAEVRGWRRVWQGTKLRKLAFLSVVPDSEGRMDGLIAAVPEADWTALDLREAAYQRHPVSQITHGQAQDFEVQIYAVEPKHREDGVHPILLSYLDTVIQGFLTEFGENGARAFFDETGGWDMPIRDDRHDPMYPRVTELTPGERAFVDENLRRTLDALEGGASRTERVSLNG